MTAKKVLVAGGAGYLGRHVTRLLGEQCLVYDNLLYANEYMTPVEFIRGDVTDHDLLKRYFDQVDCVIWLAAIVGDAACMVDPGYAIAANEAAVGFLAQNYSGPIIFMSSCSAYGVNDGTATETSLLKPQSVYAETKIRAEQLLANNRALILRLGTLHGVSERMRFDLVVNVLTLKAVLHGRIEVFGGKQYRPLLSVKEVAEFIVQMVDYDWLPGVYNLASENLSILEVADRVKAQVQEAEVQIVESPFEDHRNYRVDCSKAYNHLGFKPQILIDDSIREIATLIRSGRIKDFSDMRFANLADLQFAKRSN